MTLKIKLFLFRYMIKSLTVSHQLNKKKTTKTTENKSEQILNVNNWKKMKTTMDK